VNSSGDHSGLAADGSELLFLQTLLLGGEETPRAWEQWRAGRDLDTTAAYYTILSPTLCHSLEGLGISDPWLPRLKGYHRQSWARNQGLERQLSSLLAACDGAGCAVAAVGPLSIAKRFYSDLGRRACYRLTIAVRPADMSVVHRIMLQQGYRSAPACAAFPEPWLTIRRTVDYLHPEKATVRIQWRIGHVAIDSGIEDEVRAAFVPFRMGEQETHTLCPTDCLIQICSEGMAAEANSRLLWAVDAMSVLRTVGSEIDWELFKRRVIQLEVVPTAADAVSFLKESLSAPIPPSVSADLRGLSTTDEQLRAYRILCAKPSITTRLRRLRLVHRRWCRASGQKCGALAFLRFLREWWQEPVWRHMLRYVARRAYSGAGPTDAPPST
jgi:hypothetical protein